jgi:hypothetical protein
VRNFEPKQPKNATKDGLQLHKEYVATDESCIIGKKR